MKLGLLLIALGYGYKVYAEAVKEKGNLRTLGQWIGTFIIATSLMASALFIYGYATGKGFKGCPFAKFGAPVVSTSK